MVGGGGYQQGPTIDPRILVFEFCSGVVLRSQQVALLAKLAGHAAAGHSVCHQMLMGEGKTTVISPLLALLLANGHQLVMQVVPAPLLRFTLQVMRSVFRIGPLQKPVCTFSFDRRTEVSEILLLAATVAIEDRGVMVSTPASVKAFMLKLIELLHLLDTGQASSSTTTSITTSHLTLPLPPFTLHLLDTGQYPRMHGALGKTIY